MILLPEAIFYAPLPSHTPLHPTLTATAANKVPDDFPVIVTSYEIVIADAKFLQSKYRFK